MIALFVFPAKPSGGYYKDCPKNIATDDDSIIIKNHRESSSNYFHWIDDDDIDKMTDEQFIEYVNLSFKYNIQISKRKHGNGYYSEDKKSIVRIIRQPRRIFSNMIL